MTGRKQKWPNWRWRNSVRNRNRNVTATFLFIDDGGSHSNFPTPPTHESDYTFLPGACAGHRDGGFDAYAPLIDCYSLFRSRRGEPPPDATRCDELQLSRRLCNARYCGANFAPWGEYVGWSRVRIRPLGAIGRSSRTRPSVAESEVRQAGEQEKNTGDPSCLPEVRRAKHLARDILGSCYAASAGDSDAMERLPPLSVQKLQQPSSRANFLKSLSQRG